MKSLVLYAFILIIVPFSSTELKNMIETLNDIQVCKIENNVIDADRYSQKDIVTDLYTQPENEERTRKFGCWIACILKRQNLMEGSNIKETTQIHERINVLLVNTTDESIGNNIARKCVKQVRNITQDCEKSFFLFACATKAEYEEQIYEKHEIEEAEGKNRNTTNYINTIK